MKFTKMQGAGNDFVVIEADSAEYDWSSLAKDICDRHYGVGADSLLVLLPSYRAQFRMRTFDADGTEAEICGNGLRCLAKYAFERGLVSPEIDQISLETIAGIRTVKLGKTEGVLTSMQVGMGQPAFDADEIPVALGSGKTDVSSKKSMMVYPANIDGTRFSLNLVSMGNPHAVYFCKQPVSEFPLEVIGPKVENLSIFPNRTNFEVARVLNKEEIEVRVWERGVGETLACGSGACAVAVAAQLYSFINARVDIRLPGGTLKITWNGSSDVIMNGPAETVFTGEWLDQDVSK